MESKTTIILPLSSMPSSINNLSTFTTTTNNDNNMNNNYDPLYDNSNISMVLETVASLSSNMTDEYENVTVRMERIHLY